MAPAAGRISSIEVADSAFIATSRLRALGLVVEVPRAGRVLEEMSEKAKSSWSCEDQDSSQKGSSPVLPTGRSGVAELVITANLPSPDQS